ncbi:MAG: tetratricopeptide repeat protein [Steroidobacteraceae bacterium]
MRPRPSSAILAAVLLLAAALPPPPAGAATDEERIATYKTFRAAFDARDFAAALPAAEKLVAQTEEQYGADSRQLVTPLANLGSTQFRLAAYPAAEAAFQRALKIVEAQAAGADHALIQPLLGLGETWLATQRAAEAAVALKRAIDLSRNLDGLFNVEQLAIIDPLIEAYVALDRLQDAEKESQYAFRVAESTYGRNDKRLLEPLDRYARWFESVGRYTTARGLHARALQIAEAVGGRGTPLGVPGLRGLARSYYLEFIYGPEDAENVQSNDPFQAGPTPQITNEVGRLNPDGERALRLALDVLTKASPVDRLERGQTLVELADWHLIGGANAKAADAYAAAWTDLLAAEAAGEAARQALLAPRRLAYRPPSNSVARLHPEDPENYEEHYVEARFKVQKDGRVADAATAATDASAAAEKAVLFSVRKSRWAPRLEDGKPVDTEGVTLRERLLIRKPSEAKPAKGP